jgi:predicted DNA-binding transcriptional regulator AlpA
VSDGRLELVFPDELVERIAERTAELVVARLGSVQEKRWLTTDEAVAYTGYSAAHLYDMRSDGRLSRRGKHGHAVFDRRELDEDLARLRDPRRRQA